MNDFIVTNLQALLMGIVLLGSVIYAVSGFYRYEAEDEEMSISYKRRTGKRALAVFAASITLVASFAFVPAGYRGVVFDQGVGVIHEELPEGLSPVIPYWQRVHNVRVQTQVYEFESFIQSYDLQEITLPVAINYHPDPTRAAELFQDVGLDYAKVILDPAAFQGTTQAAGSIIAENIARSRAQLAFDILSIILPRAEEHGIVVEYVAIRDAVFDEEFIASVKAKVIADQKAEESLRLVKVAQHNAEAIRRTASGDADALALLGKGESEAIEAVASALSFTASEYLLWQRLNTWDGMLPTTVLGTSADVIVDLP